MTRNKSKRPIKNIKKIIFSSLFIASLVFIMISVSFSWFIDNDHATVSNISISVIEAENLVIKEVEGDWVHRIDISTAGGENNFTFDQVTGNGGVFYTPIQELLPVESSTGDYIFEDYQVTGIEPIDEAKLRESVYIYDFVLKIEQDNDVYLSDCTASGRGASVLRVALLSKDTDGTYKTIFIWIPDVVTKLEDDGSISSDNPETSILFHKENSEAYSVNVTGEAGYTTADGVTYLWGDIPACEYMVTSLYKNEEVDLRIVIWTEGTDRDCRDYVSLGDVNINLNFTAVKK